MDFTDIINSIASLAADGDGSLLKDWGIPASITGAALTMALTFGRAVKKGVTWGMFLLFDTEKGYITQHFTKHNRLVDSLAQLPDQFVDKTDHVINSISELKDSINTALNTQTSVLNEIKTSALQLGTEKEKLTESLRKIREHNERFADPKTHYSSVQTNKALSLIVLAISDVLKIATVDAEKLAIIDRAIHEISETLRPIEAARGT